MIFLDTNIFLRLLTAASNPATTRMKEQVRQLFDDIEDGSVDAITSELVLHEVFYVLVSKHWYSLSTADAIRAVQPLLRNRSLQIRAGDKSVVMRALDIWEANPKLEFADSVIAARCEANEWELATFDEALGTMTNLRRWSPLAP